MTHDMGSEKRVRSASYEQMRGLRAGAKQRLRMGGTLVRKAGRERWMAWGIGLFAVCIAGAAHAQATDATPAPTEAAAAEDAAATVPDEESASATRDWISGSFRTELDTAWSDEDTDVDLSQTLRLNLDPADHPRLHVRGLVRVHEDLDSSEPRSSVLRDINDGSGEAVRARLYLLHLDVDDLWGDSTLRIGRQRIEGGAAYNRIDGVSFSQRVGRWEWYVFGGARASVYDSTFDDLAAGGGVAFRPDGRTRISLDTYWGEKHRENDDEVYLSPLAALLGWDYPRRIKSDIGDNLMALSLWRQLTPNTSFFGRLRLHDGDLDEIAAQLVGYWPGADLAYEVSYRGRYATASDRVDDLTSFYEVLGSYEEFHNFLVAIHKPLTQRVQLSLEAEFHNADDDWETANRDFNRYAAILTVTPLFKATDATVALEKWDISGGDDTWAITGEVTRRWGDNVALTLGADYERYEDRITRYYAPLGIADKLLVAFVPGYYAGYNPLVFLFDQYAVTTHENVYSLYTRLKWTVRKNQDISLDITYEEDDGPDSPYWRVQAGYTIRF